MIMKERCLSLMLGLATSLIVLPASAQKVEVVEHTLTNGLRMLMVERHDEPSVAGGGLLTWEARMRSRA